MENEIAFDACGHVPGRLHGTGVSVVMSCGSVVLPVCVCVQLDWTFRAIHRR